MNDYLDSIKARDPAAKSILSIILTYPGVKAVFLHRVANFFHIAGFHLIARFKDKKEQQETFFIKDPHGNILELKTLKNA
jgi:serine O-acetyltransferase